MNDTDPTRLENSTPMFERKDSIEDYIRDNKLNKELFDTIQSIPNDEFDLVTESYPVKLDELLVFNRAYEICNDLKKAPSPLSFLEMHYNDVFNASMTWGEFKKHRDVIFCCVYVILYDSKSTNSGIKSCLAKIKGLVDRDIFQHFEPLLNEISIAQLPPNTFEQIKKQANEIADLDERIMFLDGVLAVAKLSKTDASFVNDIEGEIEQIRKKIEAEDSQRTMKVVTDTILLLLKNLKITQNDVDKTTIASFINYLTAYSKEKIRQRLSNPDELTSRHKGEVEFVNDFLSKLNVKERITYNNNR